MKASNQRKLDMTASTNICERGWGYRECCARLTKSCLCVKCNLVPTRRNQRLLYYSLYHVEREMTEKWRESDNETSNSLFTIFCREALMWLKRKLNEEEEKKLCEEAWLSEENEISKKRKSKQREEADMKREEKMKAVNEEREEKLKADWNLANEMFYSLYVKRRRERKHESVWRLTKRERKLKRREWLLLYPATFPKWRACRRKPKAGCRERNDLWRKPG